MLEEVVRQHERGLPVLVGKVSVEIAETLSRMLKRRGFKHEVLNAKYHAQEAEIVSQAGRKDTVTIATNMTAAGTALLPTSTGPSCSPTRTPSPSLQLLEMFGKQRHDVRPLRQPLKIASEAAHGRRDKFLVSALPLNQVEIAEATDNLKVSLNRRQ